MAATEVLETPATVDRSSLSGLYSQAVTLVPRGAVTAANLCHAMSQRLEEDRSPPHPGQITRW